MRIASRMRPEGRNRVTFPTGEAIYAASASQADVQTAIDSAANGDRVYLPASGSATWTTGITIPSTKGITLNGNGSTITDAYTGGDLIALSVRSDTGNAVTRVTNLTINANGVTKTSSYAEISITEAATAWDTFRIDNVTLTNLRTRGVRTFGYRISGVVDHCAFAAAYNASCQAVTVVGAGPEVSTPFTHAFALGTSQFIFVEDCTFTFDYANDGALDAYGGARYVFRHNTVTNTTIGHHGADSGGYRGPHSFELYGNTFSSSLGGGPIRCAIFRGATGVVYDNVYTGNYDGAFTLANYRSDLTYSSFWGVCDGTAPHDGNTPGGEGYASLDQVGHVFTDSLDGTNTLEPLYLWNNTENGTPALGAVGSTGQARAEVYHILDDRDYINGSERPGYTPYTYPHPLTTR